MSELHHYGVKGMKWGVRRTPEQLGHKNLKKAKTANLDKWGKDAEHNVLYIAGYSGSGKSTTAISLAKAGDKVIHLDAYAEPVIEGSGYIEKDNMNSDFNRYLDKKLPNWQDIIKASPTGGNGKLKRNSKEYWGLVDKFANAVERYGKDQFSKGNKVVVEGIQIANGWLRDNLDYYEDKPIAILKTSAIKSTMQRFSRDGGNILTGFAREIGAVDELIQWYSEMNKELRDLSIVTNAKKGQKWVDEYLRGLNR